MSQWLRLRSVAIFYKNQVQGQGQQLISGSKNSLIRELFISRYSALPAKLRSGMAVMEGPLSKWTNVMQGWQYRWFVLDENVALLSYYTVSSSSIN